MRSRLVPCVLFLLALAPAAVAAGSGATSLDRILPEIRRNTPGTFYDAEGPFPGPDGQARYRIKWMTPDGRIIWFDADARNGRMLGPARGERDDRGGRNYGNDRENRDGSRSREESQRSHFSDPRDGSGPFGNRVWPDSSYGDGRGNWDRGGDGGRDGGRGNRGHDGDGDGGGRGGRGRHRGG